MEDEDDILDLDTPVEDDEPVIVEPDEGEISIEVEGEELAAGEETPLIKKMREDLRKAQREASDLRKAQQPVAVEIGPKPDLWDDCEGDPDKYDTAMEQWRESKRAVEQVKQSQQQQSQVSAKAFEQSQIAYKARAQTLGVRDFDAAEAKVLDALGSDYLGAIIQYAPDPVSLVAALGTHQSLLDKLVAEPDPMRRLFTLAQMGTKVKITRKAPPPAEADTIVRGSAQLSAGSDKHLAKLETDAARTGDYSKVVAYQYQKEKK